VSFSFAAPGEPSTLLTTFDCKLVAKRYQKEVVVSCNKQHAFNLAEIFEVKDVNGDYTLCVAAKDEAGNLDATRDCQDWTVVVDPPAPPEITDPSDGMPVYDLTPTISGKAISRGTVEFFLGGVKVGLAQADEQGAFTFKFPEPLEEATYVLTAVVTDRAGNPSESSSPTTFTVFAPKPVARAIGGGLGCATSGGSLGLTLLGLLAGAVWRSRRRR
jgi:MYXO-CTERM domain-containing protein